jgi:CPA2 family monovalent cation:H+ antiporter-2
MFGVGLHVSIRDLLRARALAIPGAGLVFGLALSVASTVVLLRALRAAHTKE